MIVCFQSLIVLTSIHEYTTLCLCQLVAKVQKVFLRFYFTRSYKTTEVITLLTIREYGQDRVSYVIFDRSGVYTTNTVEKTKTANGTV